MGKVIGLSEKQKIILEAFGADKRFRQFYFTGGTALSSQYLHHRQSDDLDLFSESKFDSRFIGEALDELAKKFNFSVQSRFVDPSLIFDLSFGDNQTLKIDFAYYPYPLLNRSQEKVEGVTVDSLLDIGVNKLMTMTQRTEVKDFVDMFFLLMSFSFWDLREGVRMKFTREIEPYVMAADFLVCENFEYLPKMYKPLTLGELQSFYRDQAKNLGRTVVE